MKKLALFISLLFAFTKVKAQNNSYELENKYTPNQSSIFNNLFKKNDEPVPVSKIKNLVKFSPTYMFREKVYFEYERQLIKGVTATFGLGKAFGKDLIQNVYFDAFSLFEQGNVVTPSEILTNSTFSGSQPLLSLGLKIYFNDAFDSGFIEFNYVHESMNYQLNSQTAVIIQGDPVATFSMNGFSFGWGVNFLSGARNNISNQVSVKVGLKFFNFTRYDESDLPNGFTAYTRSAEDLQAHIIPSVSINYCFGFGF